MSSLDRLINLAKKTGDRLIVHNPIDEHDVVIMDLDSYEGMLFGRRGVRPQSSAELLDEINRDIAKWRADRQVEEEWNQADRLEQEYWGDEGIPFGPALQNEPSHWSSAGDVLRQRYVDPFVPTMDHSLDEDWDDDLVDEGGEEDIYGDEFDSEIGSEDIHLEDIPFGFGDEEGDEEEEGEEELHYFEPIPETATPAASPTSAVHFDAHGETSAVHFESHDEEVTEEKPLKSDVEEGDGPVFLEEPV